MTENLETWPKSFFSCHGYEDTPNYDDVKNDYLEMHDERQQGSDIEYIRFDIAKVKTDRIKDLETKVKQLEAELDKIFAEGVDKCIQACKDELQNLSGIKL